MVTILLAGGPKEEARSFERELRRMDCNVIKTSDGTPFINAELRPHIDLVMLSAGVSFDEMEPVLREMWGSGPLLLAPAGRDNTGATLRRIEAIAALRQREEEESIEAGGLELYYSERQVIIDGRCEKWPGKEFYILYCLAAGRGRTYSRRELINEIWGYGAEADERNIDVHIRRLRRRLAETPHLRIVTVRRGGYRLEVLENEDRELEEIYAAAMKCPAVQESAAELRDFA